MRFYWKLQGNKLLKKGRRIVKFKIVRHDAETRLKLIHYKNLRYYYNSLIDEIMGEDYYTANPDVINSDREAFEDMLGRINYLKESIKCKNAQIVLQAILIIIVMLLLFLASMHIIF